MASSSTGSDSPVMVELSTENSVESRIRQSAGTTSPACKITTSPKIEKDIPRFSIFTLCHQLEVGRIEVILKKWKGSPFSVPFLLLKN